MITVVEFNTQYMKKSDHCFPGQNGIWVKDNGEKWFRRTVFEIPSFEIEC